MMPLPRLAHEETVDHPPPIFTIGHSTKSIADFVELLRVGDVRQVVDIRSVPRSRTNPQYNLDRLADELAPWQIDNVQIAELGGFRKNSRSVHPESNGFWINQSLPNYAAYAHSEQFQIGRGTRRVRGGRDVEITVR